MRLARFVPMLLPILLACKDAGGPLVTPTMQVIAGAEQVATVARELPNVVEVQVTSKAGDPLPAYPINWSALDGGSVFAAYVMTGSDGMARQQWTLGAAAGMQRLVARLLDPETGAVLLDDTIWAQANPDLASHIDLRNGDLGYPGDSALVAVLVLDQFENRRAPCADGGAWQRWTWWSGDSSVALPTGQAFIAADSQVYAWVRGVATGSTSIGATLSCIPATDSLAVGVR